MSLIRKDEGMSDDSREFRDESCRDPADMSCYNIIKGVLTGTPAAAEAKAKDKAFR